MTLLNRKAKRNMFCENCGVQKHRLIEILRTDEDSSTIACTATRWRCLRCGRVQVTKELISTR